MWNFNIEDCLHQRPVDLGSTDLKGVFTLDATRSGARGAAVR